MYQTVLAIHSIIRWLVVVSLLYALYRAYTGWASKKDFSGHDNRVRHWTATIAHLQLVAGIFLYTVSPLVDYFFHNYREAVHQREIRFFGMEHSLMMFIAIIVITVGSVKAKRRPTDNEKFRTMAIWYTVGLLIIFTSIPWPFSPLVHRPYYRPF